MVQCGQCCVNIGYGPANIGYGPANAFHLRRFVVVMGGALLPIMSTPDPPLLGAAPTPREPWPRHLASLCPERVR